MRLKGELLNLLNYPVPNLMCSRDNRIACRLLINRCGLRSGSVMNECFFAMRNKTSLKGNKRSGAN